VPPAAKSAFHQEQQSQVLPPLQPGQQVLIAAADQADTLTNTATASRVAFGMNPASSAGLQHQIKKQRGKALSALLLPNGMAYSPPLSLQKVRS